VNTKAANKFSKQQVSIQTACARKNAITNLEKRLNVTQKKCNTKTLNIYGRKGNNYNTLT